MLSIISVLVNFFDPFLLQKFIHSLCIGSPKAAACFALNLQQWHIYTWAHWSQCPTVSFPGLGMSKFIHMVHGNKHYTLHIEQKSLLFGLC